jgi:hypothetical protein
VSRKYLGDEQRSLLFAFNERIEEVLYRSEIEKRAGKAVGQTEKVIRVGLDGVRETMGLSEQPR